MGFKLNIFFAVWKIDIDTIQFAIERLEQKCITKVWRYRALILTLTITWLEYTWIRLSIPETRNQIYKKKQEENIIRLKTTEKKGNMQICLRERYSREEVDRYQRKNETRCQELRESGEKKRKETMVRHWMQNGVGEEKQVKTTDSTKRNLGD